jgi:hypothetical protein
MPIHHDFKANIKQNLGWSTQRPWNIPRDPYQELE